MGIFSKRVAESEANELRQQRDRLSQARVFARNPNDYDSMDMRFDMAQEDQKQLKQAYRELAEREMGFKKKHGVFPWQW